MIPSTSKIRLVNLCLLCFLSMHTHSALANGLIVNGKDVHDYLPLLEKVKQRVMPLDPETGLYVEEIKKNLFLISNGIYQSAFIRTGDGVVVLDAPAIYGAKIPQAIKQYVPNEKIKYLIYSHAHRDHIGGSHHFAGIEDLQVIAHKNVADFLREQNDPGFLIPTISFTNKYTLTLGRETIELGDHGNFHSVEADIFIYLPNHKTLYVIDVVDAGYVPFKRFSMTVNLRRYTEIFKDILEYDFDVFISGHFNAVGNRQDVIDTRDYVYDVRDISAEIFRNTSPGQLLGKVFAELKSYDNAFLGYAHYFEVMVDQCAERIITNWKDKLANVDVWAKSNCDAYLYYHLLR